MLLALCRGIHQWLVVSPNKMPVMQEAHSCHDIINISEDLSNHLGEHLVISEKAQWWPGSGQNTNIVHFM